jgi:hypothetical protein
MFSKLWTVKLSDWQRMLIIGVFMAMLTTFYELWSVGPIDWKKVVLAGIGAAIAYIGKNFVTGQNGKLLTNK